VTKRESTARGVQPGRIGSGPNQPVLANVLGAHTSLIAKPQTTEPGKIYLQTHALILDALVKNNPDTNEQVLKSQATMLVDVRLTHPISTSQILIAIQSGSSVQEIAQSARSISTDDDSGLQRSSYESPRPSGDIYMFKEYVKDGKSRFSSWLDQLDSSLRASVEAKLARVTTESVKKLKPLQGGDHLFEIRVHDGPGLRIYVGLADDQYVLLHGGKKDDQFLDVLTACRLLSEVRSGSAEVESATYSNGST
jgi:putative addiction module killer protein